MQLTEEQLAVVKHDGNHARVAAVAGSGKTHTMVARIIELLKQGTKASEILVLMFNKTAQLDFEARLKNALADSDISGLPEVRTFHSLGFKLTNNFIRCGWLESFTLESRAYILETMAQEALDKALIKAKLKDSDEFNEKKLLEDFLSFIDLVKSDLKEPKAKFKSLVGNGTLSDKNDFFIEAYNGFEKSRKAKRINFFSDLLYEPVKVLRKSAYSQQAQKFIANRIEHIIVDEYQDVNEIQQQILKFIAGNRAKLMVVGDVDQCIYEWRGAKPDYMLKNFAKDFPELKKYKLSTTFRYGQDLSSIANKLIINNKMRDKTSSVSADGLNTSIFCEDYDNEDLSKKLISFIDDYSDSKHDTVILLRLYSMSIAIELELLKAGIPYRLEGREAVLEIKEIRALNTLLKLLDVKSEDNEISYEDLEAFFTVPHIGFKNRDLSLIIEVLVEEFKLLSTKKSKIKLINKALSDYINKTKMHPFRKKNLIARIAILKNLEQKVFAKLINNPYSIMNSYINEIKAYDSIRSLMRSEEDAEDKIRIIQSFIDYSAKHKGNFIDFYKDIESLKETELSSSSNKAQLLLTSIHRAKGLEWNNVIVPSLKEGEFPYKPVTKEEAFFQDPQIEAERRLFYVAITRARKNLLLLYPKEGVSRFVKEIRT